MAENRKLRSNLLEQDVYVRDTRPTYVDHNNYLVDEYLTMDVVPDSEQRSMKERYSVEKYPVTPESVNSYADGTNYRLDVAQAVSNPAPGKNFGDVAAMRDILSLPREELLSRLDSIRQLVESSKNNVSCETVMEENNG